MNNKLKGREEYHFTQKLPDHNQLLDSKLNIEHSVLPIKRTLTRVEENSTINRAERPEMLVVKGKRGNDTLIFEEPVEGNELLGTTENTQSYRNLADTYQSAFGQFLNFSDPVIELDENYCFTSVNREASLVLRKKPNDLIGKTLTMLYPQINWDPMIQAYKRSGSTKKIFVFEQFIPSQNKWYSARVFYRPKGPVVLFFEISTPRNKKHTLKNVDTKYSKLAKCKADFVFALDLDLKITYLSRSAEKLLGEKVENYLFKSIENVICIKSMKKLEKLLHEEMALRNFLDYGNHRHLTLETEYRSIDGSAMLLSVDFVFLRDYEGNLHEIHGLVQRINPRIDKPFELIQREKNLLLMNMELDELNSKLELKDNELKEALIRADECDRLKSTFLANMSHEIRTPMNGILGYTELLKDSGFVTEQQENCLRVIDHCGRHLLNVVDDIICISKIESNQVKIDFSETNIDKQIKSVYDLFKLEAKQKGIDIFYRIPSSSEETIISTDKEKVFVILTKLVKNALKFTKAGSIEFGYSFRVVDGDCNLVFFVKDTGIGISEEKQGIIFDKFRQGDESLRRNIEGMGLGLTISKAYVEMLGGIIWLESTLGKGSIFYFTIPINNL